MGVHVYVRSCRAPLVSRILGLLKPRNLMWHCRRVMSETTNWSELRPQIKTILDHV
jgi:hypothetical protein